MASQEAYEDLKAAKEAEIAAGQDQVATTKQDLDDTRNSLAADQKFLMNLKETCQNTDAEWEARQAEIKGCSEALAILSSDDAHDTFTRTFNFLQVKKSLKVEDKRVNEAEKVLFTAAKKLGNPRLAALASRVRLDAFSKVTEQIDGMVKDLKKEKADDIKQKDFCTEELNKNERAQELKARDIDEHGAKIADLTANIDQLTKDIAQLKAEIADMQVQLKRAGEDRELENSDFQKTIADQRATKKLLTSALNVLKAVYAKKSFVQKSARQEPAGPPPPPGFKKYEQSSGAGGVLGMLEQIIADTE